MFSQFKTSEVDWQDGVRQIDECRYLFADRISEVEELSLGLVVVEAKVQDRPYVPIDNSELEQLKSDGKPIEPDSTCRVFEVLFERAHLVLYQVLNESYGAYPEGPEKFAGKLFRTFSWSHLLEFTKRTTIAPELCPGPLQHYQIVCLNNVVDVIATGPPRIAVGPLV